jgi:protein-disulfide isomerase/uncharacterized membrane protein
LIACGLAISGYLLFRQFALASASGPVKPGVCSILLRQDCDAALQSPMSKQLGLPLAGWGIVFYGTLLTGLVLGWLIGESFQSAAVLSALVLSSLGAVLSVVLFAVMLIGTAPFCPLCAVAHVINVLLVPVYKRMAGGSARELFRAVVAAGALLLSGQLGKDAIGQVKLLAIFAWALVAVTLYQWVFIQEKLHPPAEYDVRETLAAFAISARAEIPCGEDDPRLGPPDALVRLIVFTDFQCPGCRRFAQEMAKLVETSRGKVQIVFKHFPLSAICNPALTEDRHPRACEAAWAGEAARRQGQFWRFHDTLFAADLNSPQVTVEGIARQVGLDLALFDTDQDRDEARAKVKADIDLGNRLGIRETPTIFVNGRRAPDVRAQSLHLLIISEITSLTPLPISASNPDEKANHKPAPTSP